MDKKLFALTLTLNLFLLGSFVHLVSSDYIFGQMSGCCNYQDIEKVIFEYEMQYTYNKKLILEYNSTRGKWTGFTESSVIWAAHRNSDPEDAKLRKLEQIVLCKDSSEIIKDLKNMITAPTLRLSSLKQFSGKNSALLLCSAYNFYPQDIVLTWLQNGQEVTSDVTSTEVLSDGELYYQIHSYLEYNPTPGEVLSCMVEHVSLSEPLVQLWDPHHSLRGPEKVKIIVGTLFLVVGLTTLVIGYVKNKKSSAALCTTMPGHEMVPVDVVQENEAITT